MLPLDGQAWALPLALVTDAGTTGPRLHYLHADHLGTPVAMTSANLAQLEWSATYRPFGEVQSITGTESLSLRFPGQFFDPETGFHQNWHRDYDPRLGRYVQSDPIGLEGGLNTYAYVGGDAVDLIDPSGENPAWAAIVACVRIPACRNAASALFAATVAAVQQALQPKVNFCPLPDWFLSENQDAKAPGQPTAEDGYFPPRGGPRLAKNPNGPDRGWEDGKGDVWVPTGPGPRAHGGPHWDVQSRGGGHRNVYPGGKIRSGGT